MFRDNDFGPEIRRVRVQTQRTNTPAIFFLKDQDSGDRIIPYYNNNEHPTTIYEKVLLTVVSALTLTFPLFAIPLTVIIFLFLKHKLQKNYNL